MAFHVQEKVLANVFIAGCKWNWVELLKEAIKLLCFWWKIMRITFFSAWICQPDGAVYNQILVVSAKSHKIFPIISELAKWIVRAIYVIYCVAWNQILIELSNSVNLSAVWKEQQKSLDLLAWSEEQLKFNLNIKEHATAPNYVLLQHSPRQKATEYTVICGAVHI